MGGILDQTMIPPEDEALRPKIREFLAEHMKKLSAEARARSWMGFDAEFSRALGQNNFIGLTLPKEYGGGGRSAFARYVVAEELLAAGAPVIAHWIADRQTAPSILRYGTQEQKERLIPSICRGETYCCIGMSEPNSGSDLASVRTIAKKTSEGWRLSGRKIWTTNAQYSHYMLALVRTSGAHGDRHKGLSQVLIDLSLPGIEIRPIRDIAGDEHFCEVLFDDVLLPEDALIGKEGAGWEQVNSELAFERSGPDRIFSSHSLLEEWISFLREDTEIDPHCTEMIGRAVSQIAILRCMSLEITAKLDKGESPLNDAAIVKDLGTGFEQSIPRAVGDALDLMPDRLVPDALAQSLAYTLSMAPSFSLRGGTREILRSMIARSVGLR